jgi:preprotein translocase subunit SecE
MSRVPLGHEDEVLKWFFVVLIVLAFLIAYCGIFGALFPESPPESP